jgi:glyoxylase-like metal-dependent hydrolase (beta-lactamase superfamily II)
MRVELLPSSVGASGMLQFSQSVLINDYTAIDAGSVGCLVPLERQQLIRDVFLSHSHLDHIGSLPFFLDNVYRPVPECPRILASAATFASLRSDVFNDRIWPDFVRLSREETPFLRLQELRAEDFWWMMAAVQWRSSLTLCRLAGSGSCWRVVGICGRSFWSAVFLHLLVGWRRSPGI